MTTPTNPTPAQQAAEAFRDEVRNAFDLLHVEIAELRADLAQMREGLQQAATPPAQVGTFSEMIIDTIVFMTDENGKATYKAKGTPFQKFGVKIWDEILPQFIDPATLAPGKNPIKPTPARVLMGETTNKETGIKGIGPHKVTGKI